MATRRKAAKHDTTTVSDETARFEQDILDLNEARKRLREARRLLAGETLRSQPRRGEIEPNKLYTLAAAAAEFKPDSSPSWERLVRERLEERDTLSDPFAEGCLLFYGQHIIDAVARRAEKCQSESGSPRSKSGANGNTSPDG